MAITYTNGLITITGAKGTGTLSADVGDVSNYRTLYDSVNSTDGYAYRVGYYTSGTGAGTLFFPQFAFSNYMYSYLYPDNPIIGDNTTEYVIFYNIQDIIDADTANGWGIVEESYGGMVIINADIQIGDSSNAGYLQIEKSVRFLIPDTAVSGGYFKTYSDTIIFAGQWSYSPSISRAVIKDKLDLIIDVTENGETEFLHKFRVFSEEDTYLTDNVVDNTKYLYLFGINLTVQRYLSSGTRRNYTCQIALEGISTIDTTTFNNIYAIDFLNTNTTTQNIEVAYSASVTNYALNGINVDNITITNCTTSFLYKDSFGETKISNSFINYNYLISFLDSYQTYPEMIHKYVDCTYWFGTVMTTSINDTLDSVYSSYSGAIGHLVGCEIYEIKTIKYTFKDTNNDNIEDVRFFISDVEENEVINLLSDSNGTFTKEEILIYSEKGSATVDSANDAIDHFPHTFKSRKYGYLFIEDILSMTNKIDESKLLNINPYITESTIATVAAYTGISINTTTEKITLTTNHTIQELYDYLQYWGALEANIKYDELITTNNGENFIGIYDLEVNNCTLSGNGNLDISAATKDYTTIGTGTSTITIKDDTGTYTQVSFTGLPNNTEVRMYKVSDDTEVDGIENSSGTVTFPYVHTTDLEVYVIFLNLNYNHFKIDSLTLTNTASIIPVSLSLDRNYSNP